MPMYKIEGFTTEEFNASQKVQGSPTSATAKPAAVITALSLPPQTKQPSVPTPPQKEQNIKPCRL